MRLKGMSFGYTYLVGLARLASFFFLRSQKKETKEKATTCHLILNFE